MASSMKKSALSLNTGNDLKKERSNSNASCRTNATLASVTANTIDFWNRLSQQMSYIDGSTRSSSVGRRWSSVNEAQRRSLLSDRNQSSIEDGNHPSLDDVSASNQLDQEVSNNNMSIESCFSVRKLPRTHYNSINDDPEIYPEIENHVERNSPLSWSYCACSFSSVITQSLEGSPSIIRGRSVSCNQNQTTPRDFIYYDDLSRSSLPDDTYHQCAKASRQLDFHMPKWEPTMKNGCINNDNGSENKGRIYNNLLNDHDHDYEDNEEEEENEDLEMELLQPLAGVSGRVGQIVGIRSVQEGLQKARAGTTVAETAPMGGGRRKLTRISVNRTNYYRQPRSGPKSRNAAFLTNDPMSSVPQQLKFASYGSRGLSGKRASSWEESETLQRRRSLMLAATLEQCPVGITGLPPGLLLMPSPSQLDLLDKRDVRYYFQHPYPRLFVTYFVIFCNFLLFAEDPISHSHTESDIPMLGNVFSFVVTKYPPEWRWTVIKVLMWILAMLCGMIAGKLLIHGYLCGRLLRLKMFRDDQGSWMTMFMTVIVSLFVFSHAYNVMLVLWYHDPDYKITSQMGITNSSVMKAAACGTWLGDLITALMVTDMMLQDNLYPTWATCFRRIWRRSNIPRILIFWVGSVLATSVVVTLIVSDWISWDKLNKDFISTNELSRAFLASFILVMDLLIVMQDWDFPNFTTTLHVNLPGMNVATLQWKYAEVDITGKWFNYGIIFLVMMLDLNMWKNQIFYSPLDYGQYTGPDDKVRTVNEAEVLRNSSVSLWTWESRSSHRNRTTGRFDFEDDMQMNSRYMGYPLYYKWTAFIPSIVGLVMLITLVTLYGRFPSNQSHPRDRPVDQCRDKHGKQQDLLYCEQPTEQVT